MKDTDFGNGAGHALSVDEIADPERLEHEHKHATGEIREAALQCQTDCQAGSTEDGDE